METLLGANFFLIQWLFEASKRTWFLCGCCSFWLCLFAFFFVSRSLYYVRVYNFACYSLRFCVALLQNEMSSFFVWVYACVLVVWSCFDSRLNLIVCYIFALFAHFNALGFECMRVQISIVEYSHCSYETHTLRRAARGRVKHSIAFPIRRTEYNVNNLVMQMTFCMFIRIRCWHTKPILKIAIQTRRFLMLSNLQQCLLIKWKINMVKVFNSYNFWKWSSLCLLNPLNYWNYA